MITEIHKRAVQMWVFSKLENKESNPSIVIIEHLIGTGSPLTNLPGSTVELCQKINELQGLADLTEDEKLDIQKYGVQVVISNDKSKNKMLAQPLMLVWLNRIGYLLGLVSILVGGFTWWIAVFGIGTWWAFGAAKLASQKQRSDPGPSWEMPAHLIIHILALCGLFGFSIYNFIK